MELSSLFGLWEILGPSLSGGLQSNIMSGLGAAQSIGQGLKWGVRSQPSNYVNTNWAPGSEGIPKRLNTGVSDFLAQYHKSTTLGKASTGVSEADQWAAMQANPKSVVSQNPPRIEGK